MDVIADLESLGLYKDIKLIGEGRTSFVYSAVGKMLPIRYALKVLRRELLTSAENIIAFQHEATHPSKVGNKNVVKIFDFAIANGVTTYIAMERCDGERVDRFIQRSRTDSRSLIHLLNEICTGVEGLHNAWILHRDLNPTNIFVSSNASQTGSATTSDAVKIIDLGSASTLDNANAYRHKLEPWQKQEFVCPELLDGGAVDQRADIYSVGAVAYALICGAAPPAVERDTDLNAREVQIRSRLVERLAPFPEPMRELLFNFVTTAMKTDKRERFSTASEMRAACCAPNT